MTHTEILMTAVGLLLCGALLSAVLRTQRPELALCLSLLAGVLVLTGTYAVMVIITSVAAGRWSDAVGKRRVFVAGSSAVIACAALIMAFFPVWPGALAGAAVLGIGFGAYLAVDFALLTQVLPSATARGKDMGVINIAAALPQVVAPTLAFLAVTALGGYTALFSLAAAIGLAAAVLVYRIKSVP